MEESNEMSDLTGRIAALPPEKRALLLQRLSMQRGTVASRQIYPQRRDGRAIPLSFAQQRLWFLDQLEPGNYVYNIALALRLTGTLDVAVLEQSLNELVRRHESLRTTFAVSEGEPVQIIAPPQPLPLPIIDLSSLPEVERTCEAERLAIQETQRPFDLAHGPLFRTTLVRIALKQSSHTPSDQYLLLLNMHHIITDGWSLGVLLRELSTLYTAFMTGYASPLAELPIQYADFAIWQREWLQGEELERQVAYWKKQLAGVPTVLELSTDQPRPLVRNFQGKTQHFVLSAGLTQALKALSQKEETTLFMILLAAFQILLARYSGQEDIVVGTPIANRTRAELEELIGYFVNTLALRVDLSGNPTVRELLHQVREVTLEAYAHQDLPFEQLVEVLQLERDLSHSPVFQTMFILQNTPKGAPELPNLTLGVSEVETNVAKFDVTLAMADADEGLKGALLYSMDLFEGDTITRLLGHFQRLLEAMVTDPDQQVADLPLLTEGEQRTLLVEWNQTSRPYPEGASLQSLFEEQVARSPEAVAVVTDDGTGEQLSYAQLNTRANQLAHYLRSLGVGPETLVGLCLERSANVLVGLLGILKAGGAYLPLDPSYPAERLAYMLSEAQVAVVVTASAPLAASGLDTTGSRAVCLDRDWPSIAKSSRHNPPCRVQGEQLAYVIYTSGSTGRPKGVAVSQRAIVNRLLWSQEVCPLQPGDRVLHIASISFDIALWELLGPLVAGAQVLLARRGGQQDISYLAEVLVRQQVSVAHFVPSLLRVVVVEPRFSQASQMRLLLCGGEAWYAGLGQQVRACLPQVELVQFYGPTEAAINATAWLCPVAEVPEVAPIGRPIANMGVYLLDAHQQAVPIGVAGEIYLGGVGLARGYLHRPELSAERFVPHRFSAQAGQRLYRTGDLGRYLPSGEIEYLGRIDQQVKLRGYRIELGEIEAVLAQHAAVREVVVVAREEAEGDKRLVAYVVLEQAAAAPSSSQLRAHLQAKLPEYMLPAAFVRLEQLPRNANGKVDRRALPAPDQSRLDLAEAYVAPRTPTEDLLAAIWAQVLKLDRLASSTGVTTSPWGAGRIGIYDNFFELGGHSLLATQVIARIREAFQVDVPLRSLFEAPTIAALARRLEAAAGQETPAPERPIERVPRTERLPLSFAQQRLWFLDQLEPGSPFYNIPAALRLVGKLDVPTLERSLNELVRRHESLRTTFAAADGEARQVIAPAGPLALPMIDLTSLPEMEREQEAERITFEEAKRAFDLARGPLLRTTLLRLTGGRNELRPLPTMETEGRDELRPRSAREKEGVHVEEYLLLLTMHHIIADGWSAGVFFRELSILYGALLAGETSPLADLPLQYADYALWQRQWLQGRVLDEQLSYWKERLKGAPTVLQLPTDRPRPAVQTFRGKMQSIVLSQDLTQGLKALSRQEGVTLFMSVLAGLQLLLARYCGQEDLLVGTAIANRTRVELEGIIGFFVNTLVLRLQVSGNPSVRQVLSQVREVALGAYAHQDLPFEKLVDELALPRTLSHNPLFQVFFALENASQERLDLTGLSLQQVALEMEATKVDLELTLGESEQGLVGAMSYSTDLFDDATITRLLGHLQRLLEAMVADPEQRVLDLPLLTELEREQMLQDWNQTTRPYPGEASLQSLFEEQVARSPEAVAVVTDDGTGEQLSYTQLNARANQLAHYLRSLGVGRETLVGLCLERSLDMLVGLLGILKAGGAYLPLDPHYPTERLAYMLADAQVGLLVTSSSQMDVVELATDGLHCVYLDSDWPLIAEEPRQNPAGPVLGEQLAYVIYTSGSTGRPKGVAVSQRAIVNRLLWSQEVYPLHAEDRVLHFASVSFDIALWELLPPLYAGAQLLLARPGGQQDSSYLAEVLVRQRVSVAHFMPSLLRVVLEEPLFSQASQLRLLLCGGDAWWPGLAEQVHACLPYVKLIHGYGPTEAAIIATAWTCPSAGLPEVPPIGRPIANTQVYLLDAQLQPVPIGVAGELYLGGVGLARGYLHRPELSAERFVPHPFSAQAGQRLYRTGDLARYLPTGEIEYLRRIDQQVKIRGFRIELGEIESVLGEHPAVRETVVVAREEAEGDKRLVAYIVVAPEHVAPSTSELRAHLQAKLPDYMLPAAFVLLEQLPLDANGKLDRRALPAPEESRPELWEAYVAPRTPTEQLLAAIWAQVLKLEQVGIHDNFFELGGDSILSIQIIARARQRGLHLTPKQLFQYQTIAQLAQVAEAPTPSTTEQGLVPGPVPLTPVQHAFFEQHLPHPEHFNQAVLLQVDASLDSALLEAALQQVFEHHDALRLRFSNHETGWQQQSVPPERAPFHCIDLSQDLPAQQAAALESAATDLQSRLNLQEGPLLRAALFELGQQQPKRLLLILHHLLVDTVSWPILLEDLHTASEQLVQQRPVRLPAKTTSFQSWAQRLYQYAQSETLKQEGAYWLTQPAAQLHPLPTDFAQGGNLAASARSVRVELNEGQTRALLQEVPAVYHTQINDLLLTALAQAFESWTGQGGLLVDLEGHGREDLFAEVDLSRTVGWFTSVYPLSLTLPTHQEPGAAIKHIKETLRTVPQHGIGFGLLRYLCEDQAIREALGARPQPEVSFNYLGQLDHLLTQDAFFRPAQEAIGPLVSAHHPRQHLVEINAMVVGGRLRVQWSYSTQCHHVATITQLAQIYLYALQDLITHCQSPEAGGYTPSDFPLAHLDQPTCDRLLGSLHAVEEVYPLVPTQQGMLFHTLYAPQSGMYCDVLNYLLRGPLNVVAFQQAWQQVVAHYPVLRTSLHWQGLAEPLQVVQAEVQLPWQLHDWRTLSAEDLQTRWQAFLEAEHQGGFDLTQAPLMRLALIRVEEETSRLVWTSHHVLLDGWSMALVLKDVLRCYEALCQHKQAVLVPTRPYRDYIAWLQHQDPARAEEYWREQLADWSAPTPLGVDRGQTHRSQSADEDEAEPAAVQVVSWLSAETSQALQSLARREHVTLNTVVQGSWALLLHHYSAEEEVLFGTTLSGRPAELAGVETMVGLFINTLPVRVKIPMQAQLVPWLRDVQEQQVELRQYEYSSLVDVQGYSAVPRGTPLFESIVAFENYPMDNVVNQRGSTLQIKNMQAVEHTNYPLGMSAWQGPEGRVGLRISYDPCRFDDPTMRRMLGHLQTLLESITAHPDQRVADLSFVADAEKQKMLYEWNETTRPYPEEASLRTLFEEQVARTPEAVAVLSDDDQLSYAQLNGRANQLAHYLRSLGVGPETLVGLCLERSLDLLVGLLGILKAGGAYLPLDPHYPTERLAYMLADAQVALVVTTSSQLEATELDASRFRAICLDRDWPLIAEEPRQNPAGPVLGEQLAYVIYTSGSTGRPKGVAISQQAIVNRLLWSQEIYPLQAGDRVLHFASVSFDIALWELLGPLCAGAQLLLARPGGQQDSAYLADVIVRQRVSVAHFVPSLLRVVLEEPLFSQASQLRLLLCGGDAWYAGLAQQVLTCLPRVHLVQLYGPTEATISATAWTCPLAGVPEVAPIGRHLAFPVSQTGCTRGATTFLTSAEVLEVAPIGRPIANMGVYLLDAHLQPVPIGVAGEIYLGGIGLARGYLHRTDLSAERFVPHPYSRTPGARLYRTGDLARYLPSGEIEYLGRIDQQVKIRGFRIELGEIESVLGEHPAVRETVVVAREETEGDKRLVAYVVVDQEEVAPSSSELRAHLQAKLPEYMLPAAFVLLEQLPRNVNGKLDRGALPAPEESRPELWEAYVAPRTPTERVLATIWAQVLKLEQVGIHEGVNRQSSIGIYDNFFELGGHSLLATQVIGRIREAFQVDLPMPSFFEEPTIAQMAQLIEEMFLNKLEELSEEEAVELTSSFGFANQ